MHGTKLPLSAKNLYRSSSKLLPLIDTTVNATIAIKYASNGPRSAITSTVWHNAIGQAKTNDNGRDRTRQQSISRGFYLAERSRNLCRFASIEPLAVYDL